MSAKSENLVYNKPYDKYEINTRRSGPPVPNAGEGQDVGPTPPPIVIPAEETEYITLTLTDELNKYVQLERLPNVAADLKVWAGGLIQLPIVDFDVVGDLLSWNGRGLDGILEAGETIVVVYP